MLAGDLNVSAQLLCDLQKEMVYLPVMRNDIGLLYHFTETYRTSRAIENNLMTGCCSGLKCRFIAGKTLVQEERHRPEGDHEEQQCGKGEVPPQPAGFDPVDTDAAKSEKYEAGASAGHRIQQEGECKSHDGASLALLALVESEQADEDGGRANGIEKRVVPVFSEIEHGHAR
jgi:hypothetical protein